ncbi:hypothetical protein FDECE_5257 [Fusarium decemcellulare]|nr:hypothetical protein FDECE_5257 [Fusarium decemcellulare]
MAVASSGQSPSTRLGNSAPEAQSQRSESEDEITQAPARDDGRLKPPKKDPASPHWKLSATLQAGDGCLGASYRWARRYATGLPRYLPLGWILWPRTTMNDMAPNISPPPRIHIHMNPHPHPRLSPCPDSAVFPFLPGAQTVWRYEHAQK